MIHLVMNNIVRTFLDSFSKRQCPHSAGLAENNSEIECQNFRKIVVYP
jgi:hypothetical protein